MLLDNEIKDKAKKTIIKENHDNCWSVYRTMLCKVFGYYHIIHLKCDVLLLAKDFARLKKMARKKHTHICMYI